MKNVECGKWNVVVIKVLCILSLPICLFPRHLFFLVSFCRSSLCSLCILVNLVVVVCMCLCKYIPILKYKILYYCTYVTFKKINVYLHLQSIKLTKQPLKFNR